MKKIYVVEDDHGIRELLEFLLATNNYEVEAFSSAGAFQERIATTRPDAVLLDIRLPDGNGVEISRSLHLDDNTSDIPVILMSANTDETELEESYAKDFIAKPFDVEELLARLGEQVPG